MWSNKELAAEVDAILNEQSARNWSIVLHNDDINTFDWVINCLIQYCDHNAVQAEQCAFFIHTKGKYAVKFGEKIKLKPICEALIEKGLSASLERNDNE